MKDDMWLLWLLVSGIAAIGLYWGGFALANHFIDRATIVRPRQTGATR